MASTDVGLHAYHVRAGHERRRDRGGATPNTPLVARSLVVCWVPRQGTVTTAAQLQQRAGRSAWAGTGR